MSINLSLLRKPLSVNDIDFRVQSIVGKEKKYAIILAYKDARVDMARLDEVCGPLNWKREHSRDNKNCIVSVWDDQKGQWVSKEDTGTESNTEAQKGLASDSFKRACFNWGIGRELYDYPQIFVELKPDEFYMQGDKPKASSKLRPSNWLWHSVFDENDKIQFLSAVDKTNTTRYQWGRK